MRRRFGNVHRLLLVGLVWVAFVDAATSKESEIPSVKCGGTSSETLSTCGPQKDLVVIVEESLNTRKALASLRLGAARLLLAASGRCTNAYRFHIKRYNSNGLFENMTMSAEPNEALSAFSYIEENPMKLPTCMSGCCCSTAFFDSFGGIIAGYPSTTIYFAIIECFTTPDLAALSNLRLKLSSARLFLIKLSDSYCHSDGGSLYDLGLTDTIFFVRSEDVLESVSLFYNVRQVSGTASTRCHNTEAGYTVRNGTRGIGLTLMHGDLNGPPLHTDPSGNAWTGETLVYINTSEAAVMAFYPACGDGWVAVRGQCYRVLRPMAWQAANTACHVLGGTLLSLFSPSDIDALEHPELRRQLDGAALVPSGIWLGLHDAGSSGEWVWEYLKGNVSLRNIKFSNWAANEPATVIPALKQCAMVNIKTSKWHSKLCISLLPSVCARPFSTFDFILADSQPAYITPGIWTTTVDSFTYCSLKYYLLF